MAQITQDLDKRCKICQDKSYRAPLIKNLLANSLLKVDLRRVNDPQQEEEEEDTESGSLKAKH